MKKSNILWGCAAALAIGSATSLQAAFSDDFESFSLGSVDGQGNWHYAGPPSPYGVDVVSSPPALDGSKSLLFSDAGTAWLTADRDVAVAETESDGAKLVWSFKSLQAPGPGVSELLMTPYRSGFDGTNYQFSAISRHYIWAAGDGAIYFYNTTSGVTTPLYVGWEANKWYRIEMTTHINGGADGTFTNDVKVVDGTSNTILASEVALPGGTVNSRTHFSMLELTTGSSSTGQYQLDSVSLIAPFPGWNTQSGDWNSPSSWTGGVPNAPDAIALFGGSITGPATAYTNSAVTVGRVIFDNPNTYVISGAGSLSIDVTTGEGSIEVVQGSHKINLPLFLNDNTTASVAAGATLTIGNPLTLVAGSTLSKTGAGDLVIEAPVRNAGAAAMVVSGGTARLNYPVGTAASASAAASAALDVSVTGSTLVLGANQVLRGLSAATVNAGDQEIDLAGYSAQIYSANASAAEQGIYNAIKNARQSASGKDGIYDSTIASSIYAVGVTDQALDAHGDHLVVVKKTILGDTNVDGHVDVIDLGILATSWQTSGLWDNGDSNFDGFIDVIDLGMLATNWQQSAGGPSLGEALSAYGLPAVSVPEPASIGLIGLLGGLMLSRKRRS